MIPTWNRTEPPSNALAVGWIALKWANSKHPDVPAMMLKLPIRNLIRDSSKDPQGRGTPGPHVRWDPYHSHTSRDSGMGGMGVPPWNVPRFFFRSFCSQQFKVYGKCFRHRGCSGMFISGHWPSTQIWD